MRRVTYSMGVSLDGYIVGPDGGFDWTAPDEEVFRHSINEVPAVDAYLLGRRLYETMLYWETADRDPSLDESRLQFAAIWKPSPKWCSPRRCRLCRATPAWLRAAWPRRSSGCEPSRGKATSRSAARLSPPRRPRWISSTSTGPGSTRCFGGGLPYFPQHERRVDLELVETRTFSRESSAFAIAWRVDVGWRFLRPLSCTRRYRAR
jgi:hypothetical protein